MKFKAEYFAIGVMFALGLAWMGGIAYGIHNQTIEDFETELAYQSLDDRCKSLNGVVIPIGRTPDTYGCVRVPVLQLNIR